MDSKSFSFTQFECMLTRHYGVAKILVSPYEVPQALDNILDGLQDMRDDSALCQALSDHGDLCDLAARVAAVRMLRRKLADQDLTDAEHAALNALRADTCEWIRAEAGRALVELAEPLHSQDAVHDGDPTP